MNHKHPATRNGIAALAAGSILIAASSSTAAITRRPEQDDGGTNRPADAADWTGDAKDHPRFGPVDSPTLGQAATQTDAEVDVIEDVETVVAVAMPDDFPVGSVMRADCTVVMRVQFPSGSAHEMQSCTLKDEPVMVPENQGTPPDAVFNHSVGPCEWASDYWHAKDETTVYADSAHLVVAPTGEVHAWATYGVDPLDCEGES
jgi:hypothetical protein